MIGQITGGAAESAARLSLLYRAAANGRSVPARWFRAVPGGSGGLWPVPAGSEGFRLLRFSLVAVACDMTGRGYTGRFGVHRCRPIPETDSGAGFPFRLCCSSVTWNALQPALSAGLVASDRGPRGCEPLLSDVFLCCGHRVTRETSEARHRSFAAACDGRGSRVSRAAQSQQTRHQTSAPSVSPKLARLTWPVDHSSASLLPVYVYISSISSNYSFLNSFARSFVRSVFVRWFVSPFVSAMACWPSQSLMTHGWEPAAGKSRRSWLFSGSGGHVLLSRVITGIKPIPVLSESHILF